MLRGAWAAAGSKASYMQTNSALGALCGDSHCPEAATAGGEGPRRGRSPVAGGVPLGLQLPSHSCVRGGQERERRQRARCLPQAAGTLVSWVRACCWGLVEGEKGNARREDEIMHPSLAQIGVVRLGDARSSLPDSAL